MNWKEISEFATAHYPDAQARYYWAAQDCMTSAMTAAMVLRDMITKKECSYAPVFSPSRTMLRTQLFMNAFEATTNLLTPTTKRCPHLGCALKWNPQEHSWDCPCHGSRFTENGELIDNPATDDLRRPN